MPPGRPSDDLLLQLIREGKHDSEMAIRLGVTTGELRERKTDLRNRLGYERYEALTKSGAAKPRSKRRRNVHVAITGVIGAFALLLVVANLLDSGEEALSTRIVGPTPVAAAAEPELPEILIIEGEAYDDAGPFLSTADAPGASIGRVENEPGLVLVRLTGAGFISPSEFASWDIGDASLTQVRIASELGGRFVEVRVTPDTQVTMLRRLADGLGPIIEVGSQFDAYPPAVRLRAYGRDGRQLQARVTDEGRLYVSHSPIPSTWVIDRESGRLMDTKGSTTLARIVVGDGLVSATSFCTGLTSEPRCGVSLVRSKGMFTQVEGTLSCTGPTSLRFESQGIRLDITRGVLVSNANPLSCEPEVMPIDSRIVPESDWEILATTTDGLPLSVGVTNDGTLLVGEFRR